MKKFTRVFLVLVIMGWFGYSATQSLQNNSDTHAVNTATISVTAEARYQEAAILDAVSGNNKIISPLSIKMTMGMLQSAAQPKTATRSDIDHFLNTDNYAMTAQNYLKSITSDSIRTNADQSDPEFEYNINNFFYYDKEMRLNPQYKQLLISNFLAKIKKINTTNPTASARRINRDIKTATHGLIPEIISPDQITGQTCAVLTNTVYFKKMWDYSDWEKCRSQDNIFMTFDQKQIVGKQMQSEADYYMENENATAFAKYISSGCYLIGILPHKKENFCVSELGLDALLNFNNWIKKSESLGIHIQMPELDVETDLNLSALPTSENASECMQRQEFQNMFINEGNLEKIIFRQKTKLTIDTKSIVGAAATGTLVATAMPIVRSEKKEIKKVCLNRPFAFAIYDKDNDQLLFLGKITSP